MNQQRRSILCPNCGKLISIDESRCPYCHVKNPGSRWKNNAWTRGFQNPSQLIRAIIYLNIGMYVISLILKPTGTSLSMNPLTFLAPDDSSLILLGATGTVPIDYYYLYLKSKIGAAPLFIDHFPRWWTMLSANYLHGGVLHIFFNMMAFRQLAPFVIREFGPYRMFIIYTIGGIVGFAVSYLAGIRFTIGASAAVCSLIGATLFYGKSRGGIYGQAIYRQVGAWALVLFLFGFIVPGINNWGHGGGLLGGALLAYLMGYHEKSRERLVHKTMAGVCVLMTAAVLGLCLITGVYYLLT